MSFLAAPSSIPEALTFDDVLLRPAHSMVLPADADTRTKFSRHINLAIPIASAAMDTVTGHEMAIALAQAGGIGVVHRNLSADEQAMEVRRVKKFESGMVVDPLCLPPDIPLRQAIEIMEQNRISGVPVYDPSSGKLAGILTNRDIRFAKDLDLTVDHYMTKDNLITVRDNIGRDEAEALLHKHRIEKLLVVDGGYRCIGLITVKDIVKAKDHPNATKDEKGRLRVAAAIGTGENGLERAEKLRDAGVDALVIDTAHGHSQGVLDQVKKVRALCPNLDLVAGNIATEEAAKDLIKTGIDAIKIGIGPGSICTTRIVAGVGVPQLSAIMECARVAAKSKIPLIADGGIKSSGDMAKAIAAGADCTMMGSMLAGTDESPGDVVMYQGRSYKTYRGMGSVGAMTRGSSDRYFQKHVKDSLKLVPEGVEGRVPYKGAVANILHQMTGGLRASMGYTGNATIEDMKTKCQFMRITNAGLKESHVHDVSVTVEAPNYSSKS